MGGGGIRKLMCSIKKVLDLYSTEKISSLILVMVRKPEDRPFALK